MVAHSVRVPMKAFPLGQQWKQCEGEWANLS